jgi:hypothetical protein
MPLKPPWATTEDGDLIFGLAPAKFYFIENGDRTSGLINVCQYSCELDQVLQDPAKYPDSNGELLQRMLGHKKYRKIVHAPTTRNHEANWRCKRLPTDVIDVPYLKKENAFFRSKSKGVLWWATMVAFRKVHFLLDYIDLDAVVHKSQNHHIDEPKIRGQSVYLTEEVPFGKAQEGQSKYRVITNAELRWIYRNRMFPTVMKYVQFWRQGRQCLPPWDQPEWWNLWRRHDSWQEKYKPTSTT